MRRSREWDENRGGWSGHVRARAPALERARTGDESQGCLQWVSGPLQGAAVPPRCRVRRLRLLSRQARRVEGAGSPEPPDSGLSEWAPSASRPGCSSGSVRLGRQRARAWEEGGRGHFVARTTDTGGASLRKRSDPCELARQSQRERTCTGPEQVQIGASCAATVSSVAASAIALLLATHTLVPRAVPRAKTLQCD